MPENGGDDMDMGILDMSLREVLDTQTEGICMTDADREIIYWNRSAEQITGYAAKDVLGKHCYDDILMCVDAGGKSLCSDGCFLQKCIETGQHRVVDHVVLARKDGERVAVCARFSPLEIKGQRLGVQVFGGAQEAPGKTPVDKTQQLAFAAIADELTGAYSQPYVDTILRQLYGLFKRNYQRFGVVVIDIDGFSDLVDRFGRQAGDEILKTVATTLKAELRVMDIPGRFGENAFVVVCPLTEMEGLERLSERVVHAVQHAKFAAPEGVEMPREATVSAGASMIDYKDKSAADVVARASEALGRAKREGGNWYALG